jgi:hyperosmotically inducible protein
MSTTQNIRKRSRPSLAIVCSVLLTGLLFNANVAQAASDPEPTVAATTERAVSDSWITAKVKSEILANSVSKAFKVSVKTKSGVVSLRGKLPSQDAIDLVKMTAEQVKGVKSVKVSGLSIGN